MPTLLLALDGSMEAEAAVPCAVELASSRGLTLELVTVVPPMVDLRAVSGAPVPDPSWRADQQSTLRRAAHDYLTQVGAAVAAHTPGLALSTTVLDGAPAPTLAVHARDRAAVGLALTTHGRGGMSRLWLGSVADALLRQANLPVLIVRSPDRDLGGLDDVPSTADAIAAALVSHRSMLGRVMITYDGSCEAEGVSAPVRALLGNAPHYVLARVASPLHPMLRRIATASEYERDMAEQEHRAAGFLAAHATTLRAGGLSCEVCVPVGMDTAALIVEHAAQNQVGLIALATHARGPLGRAVLGSVADKVLRASPLPVLLYRLPDRLA